VRACAEWSAPHKQPRGGFDCPRRYLTSPWSRVQISVKADPYDDFGGPWVPFLVSRWRLHLQVNGRTLWSWTRYPRRPWRLERYKDRARVRHLAGV
jgi:hypothetical protein